MLLPAAMLAEMGHRDVGFGRDPSSTLSLRSDQRKEEGVGQQTCTLKDSAAGWCSTRTSKLNFLNKCSVPSGMQHASTTSLANEATLAN